MSPEANGLLAAKIAVAVDRGAILSVDGQIAPARANSDVVACHWIVPLVPILPGPVAPSCSVKNTAVHVPAAGFVTWTLA